MSPQHLLSACLLSRRLHRLRFRTAHVAVKARSSLEVKLEEEQVGFRLLERRVALQTQFDALAPTNPSVPPKLQELQQGESFVE